MISLKSLLKNMKEAKITKPQRGVETPLDAKVQVPGYGVMTRKQLQQNIKRFIGDVNNHVKKRRNQVKHLLFCINVEF